MAYDTARADRAMLFDADFDAQRSASRAHRLVWRGAPGAGGTLAWVDAAGQMVGNGARLAAGQAPLALTLLPGATGGAGPLSGAPAERAGGSAVPRHANADSLPDDVGETPNAIASGLSVALSALVVVLLGAAAATAWVWGGDVAYLLASAFAGLSLIGAWIASSRTSPEPPDSAASSSGCGGAGSSGRGSASFGGSSRRRR